MEEFNERMNGVSSPIMEQCVFDINAVKPMSSAATDV
jgi:hypothetical protein